MFLMWGYEGEQMEDIEETIHHVKRTSPDIFFTTVAYPIRGTPYFDEVAGRVTSATSWEEGSDRDFRIRGRHSRKFYQNADQLLRAEVELEKVLSSNLPGTESAVLQIRERIAQAREGLRNTFAESEA
jgi:anaerobic magnesium-protoporphyrin IX monomethyl ester cyclase